MQRGCLAGIARNTGPSLVQRRGADTRLAVPVIARLAVVSLGPEVVLPDTGAGFVCNGQLEAAGRLEAVAGFLEQLRSDRIIRRDTGACGTEATEAQASDSDVGVAAALEEVGRAGEVLRDAFARGVERSEMSTPHGIAAAARTLEECRRTIDVGWDSRSSAVQNAEACAAVHRVQFASLLEQCDCTGRVASNAAVARLVCDAEAGARVADAALAGGFEELGGADVIAE